MFIEEAAKHHEERDHDKAYLSTLMIITRLMPKSKKKI